jgi:hypothetical protein
MDIAAGWSSSVARWAHNPEVAGSNPAPATKVKGRIRIRIRPFACSLCTDCAQRLQVHLSCQRATEETHSSGIATWVARGRFAGLGMSPQPKEWARWCRVPS